MRGKEKGNPPPFVPLPSERKRKEGKRKGVSPGDEEKGGRAWRQLFEKGEK